MSHRPPLPETFSTDYPPALGVTPSAFLRGKNDANAPRVCSGRSRCTQSGKKSLAGRKRGAISFSASKLASILSRSSPSGLGATEPDESEIARVREIAKEWRFRAHQLRFAERILGKSQGRRLRPVAENFRGQLPPGDVRTQKR